MCRSLSEGTSRTHTCHWMFVVRRSVWGARTRSSRRLVGASLAREGLSGAGCVAQIHHVRLSDRLEHLEEIVERFWRTQAMPVVDAPRGFMAPDDKASLDHLQATIRHTGVRYEVGLPKRESVAKFSDNPEAVRRRFLALERRLRNDQEACRANYSRRTRRRRRRTAAQGELVPALPRRSEPEQTR